MTDEEQAVDQQDDNELEENLDQEGQDQELSDEEQAMAKLKEAITVEQEDIGSLRRKLTVTIPRDTLDDRLGEQFTELKRDAVVPGFRKGHAPLVLVEKRFGADVGEQLISQLLSSGYLAAVEKEELKVLGDPLFWVKVSEEREGENQQTEKVETEKLLPMDKALDELKLPKEGPLTFSCEIELKPEFELPQLDKIPVKKPSVEITDEDVEVEIKRMCMSRGTFEPVEDGAVELDDLLYVAMKMSVGDEVLASDDNYDMSARDMRIKGVPLAGLGEALKGKKTGESVTFEGTVPEDHENIDARGKTAKFEFTINEIKRLYVPGLDEELLTSFGYDTEDELRETMRYVLESRLDSTIKKGMRQQVSDYLVDKTTLELPEGLSQRQTDRSIARRMIEMYQAGIPQAELEKSMDEMRTRAHDQAVRDLKLYFILEKVAEDRGIEVSEEQINSAIAEIARRSDKRFDRMRDELSKSDGMATLYLQLRDNLTLDALLEEAEVEEMEGPEKGAPGE